ncbi:MAG: DNA-processing protein DprA [Candidatus Limnocylindrales bacterium]
MTIADDAYPPRLRERLRDSAPPVLFGSGDAGLLRTGGIAIVGSRDADRAATDFTQHFAAAAARGGTPVVSGGARGIDATAMQAAFAAGGSVIGVVPEGVERRLREAATRSAVAGGQALLVSPYHPLAAFSAGAAMGRNKLIYALSDVAVVVSSAEGSGGTWTGALEALKGGWVPVFVREGVRRAGRESRPGLARAGTPAGRTRTGNGHLDRHAGPRASAAASSGAGTCQRSDATLRLTDRPGPGARTAPGEPLCDSTDAQPGWAWHIRGER